jgi:DNA-binding winged helix-turn-helix (wHTH) protein
MTDYAFGRFVLQPTERRLTLDDSPVSIGPRAFDLLVLLVGQAGHLVTRKELTQSVWHGLVVEEGNLHVQISNLRKVLGASSIETVQRVGYRFTLPVQERAARYSSATRTIALPKPITSFVGRSDELGSLVDAMTQTRLLTLTGMGGSGKTRLALQLAEAVAPQHPSNVWFVSLASLSDARLVVQAISDTIGIRPAAGQSGMDALRFALSGRDALLVLDGCERVGHGAADQVSSLLEGIYDLTIIATTRETLGIPEERRFPVMPLSLLPSAYGKGVPESDAVRLFIERAIAVRPGLEVSADARLQILAICQRLDGFPLAIELAAATLNVLSLAQLHELLSDRFTLLAPRPGHMRTEGLSDVIAWSFSRLDESDRLA